MKSLGIIGFGNMGEAIAEGVLKVNHDLDINVVEKSPDRIQVAVEKYHAKDFTGDMAAFFAKSDYILIAIKPQDLESLLTAIAPLTKTAKIITILAGKTLETYLKHCGTAQVARLMPNLAASCGKSVTGISFSANAREDFKKEVVALSSAIGISLEVPEHLMSAVVGVSGSGIAFVFEFIHAMAMAGTQAGIAYAKSLELCLAVVDGALASLRSASVHPSEMVSRVCSPGGTTIAGINELEQAGFRAGIMNAVMAAARRATELET